MLSTWNWRSFARRPASKFRSPHISRVRVQHCGGLGQGEKLPLQSNGSCSRPAYVAACLRACASGIGHDAVGEDVDESSCCGVKCSRLWLQLLWIWTYAGAVTQYVCRLF
jgi:hypothetical protein